MNRNILYLSAVNVHLPYLQDKVFSAVLLQQ